MLNAKGRARCLGGREIGYRNRCKREELRIITRPYKKILSAFTGE